MLFLENCKTMSAKPSPLYNLAETFKFQLQFFSLSMPEFDISEVTFEVPHMLHFSISVMAR